MEEFAALIAIVRCANPNSRVIRIRWDVRILKPFCAMYVALWKTLNVAANKVSAYIFCFKLFFGSK
jgi:hypothetical protein